MNLSIETIKLKDCNGCMLGKIAIGTFEEYFSQSLDDWSLKDYKRQWKEGLERIKTENTSCLVTNVQDPIKGPFVNWWLLYKIGSKIYIQNQIVFEEAYRNQIGNQLFTPKTCYQFIGPRETIGDLGEISEWSVDI